MLRAAAADDDDYYDDAAAYDTPAMLYFRLRRQPRHLILMPPRLSCFFMLLRAMI